jgi:hypothetical protein
MEPNRGRGARHAVRRDPGDVTMLTEFESLLQRQAACDIADPQAYLCLRSAQGCRARPLTARGKSGLSAGHRLATRRRAPL